jgi:transposase
MHMSRAAEVQRFEVFSGTGRRRRWPAGVKARIVAESYAEHDTVSGVARRHGLTVQQLFAWRREHRECAGRPTGFVPVVVAEERPSTRRSLAVREAAITIELCGARIHVPPGIDAAALHMVLRAVKGLA